MNEKNLLKADFLTSIGLVIFGVVVLVDSWQMPRFEAQKVNPYSVPGLVPGMLGVLFVFLGAIMLVRSIRRGGHRLELTMDSVWAYFRDAGNRRFVIALGLCLIYSVGMIGILPYSLGTGLFVMSFIVIFEYDPGKTPGEQVRPILFALIQGVLIAAAVTFVFQELFLVNLP